MSDALLILNAASSSLKFSVFLDRDPPRPCSAALGRLDALVFAGGIGENAVSIRSRVCEDARWLGLEVDAQANAKGDLCISRAGSQVSAWVIPTNEELMIALHTRRLLNAAK